MEAVVWRRHWRGGQTGEDPQQVETCLGVAAAIDKVIEIEIATVTGQYH